MVFYGFLINYDDTTCVNSQNGLTPEEMIIENFLQVEQFYYTITEQLFKTFCVIFFCSLHFIFNQI